MACSSAGATRIPRSSGSSASTRPRSADWSTTSRTTSRSAPRRRAFAQGAFAAATEIELLRSPTLDPYDRTLAYLFINGRNFSVMAIKAGYSGETVSHYGDNGLPANPPRSWPPRSPSRRPRSSRLTCTGDAHADELAQGERTISQELTVRSESTGSASNRRQEDYEMPIIGLKGERVRLVPPDRTLHLENALIWLNDPEITATLKFNLGVTRAAGGKFLRQIETQRENGFHLGDPRRSRAAHRLHRPP